MQRQLGLEGEVNDMSMHTNHTVSKPLIPPWTKVALVKIAEIQTFFVITTKQKPKNIKPKGESNYCVLETVCFK